MTARHAQLQALSRIARIKADQELKRFSAFRRHVGALDDRIADLQAELVEVADGAVGVWAEDQADAPLRQARLAHALTRHVAIEREAALTERERLSARFDAARADAARAFGRAEVLDTLKDRAAAERRKAKG